MSEIVSMLSVKSYFRPMTAASVEQIAEAEQKLGLQFSNEYREYLSAFGLVSFYGHELTGICAFPRLNVVSVTIAEQINNPVVPMNLYVVEQTNVDGIVIWQSETGEVYQTTPNSFPVKLSESLCEYIEL